MAATTAKFRMVGVEHAAILRKVTGTPDTIVETDLHFINNVGVDAITNDIDFEGDNQTVRKTFLNGLTITAALDTYDLAAVSNAFAKDEVTSITGVAGRVYFGDLNEAAGVRAGFLSQVKAENLTTGVNETIKVTAPYTRLSLVTPPTLAFNTKGTMELTFAAERTAVDLLNVALDGVPAGGAMWYFDRITP